MKRGPKTSLSSEEDVNTGVDHDDIDPFSTDYTLSGDRTGDRSEHQRESWRDQMDRAVGLVLL